MPSYSPTLGAPQAGNLDFQGFEARRLRLHDLGANSMAHASNWNGTPKDGAIGYSSDAGDKRPYFYDTATGTDIPWLRGAYQETIAAQWNFTIATGTSPFAVTSTTVVTNLNADRTDGYHAAETATASTLAARDSNGRLTAADPSGSANGELITYGFMFSFMAGVRDPKAAVLAIYPTVLPAFTFSAGGNTITADAFGSINPVDGQTLAVNDRIGIVFETGATKPYNGIFIVTQVGTAGTPFILSRAVDANQDAEVTNGMQFWVTTGTTYGSSGWLLTTPDPITLNTTDLNFIQNNGATGITAGNGIVKAGNTIHAIQSSAYTQWGVVYAPTTATLALTAAGTAGYYFAGAGGSAPVWTAPAALTRTDDTNVTLTLGGSPSVALLAAASLTLGWTGTLSVARGGTGVGTLTGMLRGNGTGAIDAVNGATNRVTFWSDANTISSSANLTYDGTKITLASGDIYLDFGQAVRWGTNLGIVRTAADMEFDTIDTFTFKRFNGSSYVTNWQILSSGILQSSGAQTIQTSTGILTLKSTDSQVNIWGGAAGTRLSNYFVSARTISGMTELTNVFFSGSAASTEDYTGFEAYGDGGGASRDGKFVVYVRDGGTQRSLTLDGSVAGGYLTWVGTSLFSGLVSIDADLSFVGAQTVSTTAGILTVTGTGGLTLSTAANTNILFSPNGTGFVQINSLAQQTYDSADTSAIIDVLTLQRTTSGTAANGIGNAILFQSEDAGGTTVTTGRIKSSLNTAAAASRFSTISMESRAGGVVSIVDTSATVSNILLTPSSTGKVIVDADLTFVGAQTLSTDSGILTVTGTGGLTLSTAANTNILLSPNGTGITRAKSAENGALNVIGISSSAQIKLERTSTSAGVGYIGADDANAITVFDSSFNTRMTVSQAGVVTIPGSLNITPMTAKSILFAGASGAVSQSNSEFQVDTASIFRMGFGTTVSDTAKVAIGGSWAPAFTGGTQNGVSVTTSVTGAADGDIYVVSIGGTLVEAGSGTHSMLAGTAMAAPTITVGAATVTNAATLYILGAPSATVSGGLFSFYIGSGNVYLGTGNTVQLGGSSSGIVSLATAAAAGTWTLTLPTSGGTNNYFLSTNGSGVSAWTQPTAAMIGSGAALTKTDDTNITLTLGGSPTTALLAATSLTLGWTGTLAASRGGTGRAVFTYTTTFGDASNATFTITHNLGSKDVCVTIYETASPYTEWYSFVVKKASTNTITIDCGFIPGSGEFTVGIK